MAKCNSIIWCESLTRETDTGRTTIRGIIDGFNVPSLPLVHTVSVLSLTFCEAIEPFELNIDVVHLESAWKDRINREPLAIPAIPSGLQGTANAEIDVLELPNAGTYVFIVRNGETELTRYYFQVRVIDKTDPRSA